jgi:hypothetical protein
MAGNVLAKRIQADLRDAVKDRDKARVGVLRMLLSELKNAELDEREELSDDKELAVVSSYARRVKESIEEFRKGGRDDLVARECSELAIVMTYLPEQMSDDEVRSEAANVIAEIGASSPRDMGRVMGEMMKRFKGRVDGGAVNRVVIELLRKG